MPRRYPTEVRRQVIELARSGTIWVALCWKPSWNRSHLPKTPHVAFFAMSRMPGSVVPGRVRHSVRRNCGKTASGKLTADDLIDQLAVKAEGGSDIEKVPVKRL